MTQTSIMVVKSAPLLSAMGHLHHFFSYYINGWLFVCFRRGSTSWSFFKFMITFQISKCTFIIIFPVFVCVLFSFAGLLLRYDVIVIFNLLDTSVHSFPTARFLLFFIYLFSFLFLLFLSFLILDSSSVWISKNLFTSNMIFESGILNWKLVDSSGCVHSFTSVCTNDYCWYHCLPKASLVASELWTDFVSHW
jgi:hypothetical protein